MSALGQLAEWLVRLTEGDTRPPPANPESAGRGLESLRRVIAAYARLHRPVPEAGPREVLFRWGHLEVLEAIGSGSYGEVFRAFDGVLERDVALKLRSSEQVAARAYILEARRLARVRHPHVLAIHGAAVNDGRVGIWADLIEGQTLSAQVADDGPRPRTEVLAAGRVLASALAAVHRAGLIHGDVKPGNIMRGADGGLVLMDFGAAIERAAGGARATLGSPLTMAPEQLDGSPIGPGADLYALGVVLFYLATGRYPLESDSIDELVATHARGAVADVKPLRRALGDAPTRLIARLLARDPAARPSAGQTLHALADIERAPQRRQKRIAVTAIIVALSLGFAAAGVGYLRASHAAHRAEQVNTFVLSLFDQANVFDPSNTGETDAADLLRSGVERVRTELADQPRVQAQLLVVIGRGLWRLGERNDAEAADRLALDLMQAMDRPDPEVHAQALKTLGSSRLNRGDLDGAQNYYDRALVVADQADVEAATRFSILTGLAHLATTRGDPERALKMRLKLVDARIAANGPVDPDLAMDYFSLGTNYLVLQNYVEAERNYRRSRAMVIQTLGPEHARLFYVDQSLATALRLQGRLDDARTLAEDAAQRMRARDLRATNAYVTLLRTWASILRLQHRVEEALPLVAEALALAPAKTDVARHGALVRERGACLLALSKWSAAEQAFAQAESLYGDTRPDLRNMIHALRFYAAWRDHADPAARDEIQTAVDAIERAGHRGAYAWLIATPLLSRVLRDQGDVAAALDWHRRVRERVVELGFMGAIGHAAADAEVALSLAALPNADASKAAARLDAALAALTKADPEHPLREELVAARAALADHADATASPRMRGEG